MIGITGTEIMNPDLKDKQVRRCGTCGFIVGLGHVGRCPSCKGPIISLGPISWTEEDERKAMNDLGIFEDREDRFQDMVCFLWDMIEEAEDQIIDQAAKIEELGEEIDADKKEIEELKTRLSDASLKAKVKKTLGVE